MAQFVDEEDFEILTDKETITMSDNTIDNPVVALRNKDLDADTKILRKYELEDASGRRLSYADEAIMDKLWKDQRAEFAAELRALEDATKPAGVDTTPTV